ncbi:MAG: transporter substrate-binding domain-containing protein, partial [Treponema sp.]|nr:transporter substrate-binding domain-containing protein [Treponema sp.]
MKIKVTILLLLVISLSGCFNNTAKPLNGTGGIKSYRDVPGITSIEIAAIEAFQATGRSFSYGSMKTTEAFKLQDGTNAGFSALFCEFLSELLGIPFIQEAHGWDSIVDGLEKMTLDFSGDLILTPERRQVYFMTNPIAARLFGIFYSDKNRDKFAKEEDINGLRIGFYEGGVIAQSIMEAYPDLNFESVYLYNPQDVAESLASGKIDAFIVDAVISVEFEDYPWIESKIFFPLIYAPVSMTTKNQDLKPIISVIDKYIEAGGIDHLFHLYDYGRREYAKHELRRTFTGEEAAYIDNLKKNGTKIPVALEHDYYPVCFFNKKDNEFQGSMPDMLKEISALTGMEFQVVTDKDTPFYKALEMVDRSDAAFISALGYTPERKEKYLWSERHYACYYALLSKIDYPQLDMYQVARARVGVSRGTNYEELYKSWFKHDSNLVYFNSIIEAMNALAKGEVDRVMASENALFTMNNYFEKPGYKANILFRTHEEVYLGFNKNETVLASIISKTQKQINIERINDQWKSRVFNYERKLAEAQRPWLVGAICLSLTVLALLIFMFYRKRNERKRLERLVTERTAILNAMFDSIPDVVICKDLNLSYTRCNKVAEELNNIREKDIIGKSDIDGFGFPADVAEMIMEADRTTIREGRKVITEEKITYPDGITRTLETVRVPIKQDGGIVGLIAIARDITQRKEAENAAKAASRSKSAFLANMSHEIRTPMNSVIGFSELALDGETNPKTKEYLNKILENSEWLLQIINDVLDISKIESGKMELEHIPFDLHELFTACRTLITPKAVEKGIALHFYAEPSIGKKLLGDPTRLRQVIINILSNAIKFTNTGSVKMAATVNGKPNGDITIHFEIKDSGIGMTEEQISKIFEPFTQAESGTTRKYGGSGLGLTITKNIIDLMGGNLLVDSTPGLGSKFSFNLTFKTIDTPEHERPIKNR